MRSSWRVRQNTQSFVYTQTDRELMVSMLSVPLKWCWSRWYWRRCWHLQQNNNEHGAQWYII